MIDGMRNLGSEVAARGRCKRSTLAEAQRADRGLMVTARGEESARQPEPQGDGYNRPKGGEKKGTRKKRQRVERKGRRGWEKEEKETGRKRVLRERDGLAGGARPRRSAVGGQQATRALQTVMPLTTGLNYLVPVVLMPCTLLVFGLSKFWPRPPCFWW